LKDEAATSFGTKALLKLKKCTSLFSAGKVSAGVPGVVHTRHAVVQKSTR